MLMAGGVITVLSLLRREAPRLIAVLMLLLTSFALVWLFLQ